MGDLFDQTLKTIQAAMNLGSRGSTGSTGSASLTMTKGEFKARHEFTKRVGEAQRIRDKYPDRIPVIVERADLAAPTIDKQKYLVPADLSVGQFLFVVRKRIKLQQDKALYLFVNNSLPPAGQLVSELYAQFGKRSSPADPERDGFLYLSYSLESTFG